MKKILLLVACSLSMWTCSKTPAFPDPGFDMVSDKKVTIRRDTCEVYNIRLNVSAPGGVDKIQILNGRTLEVVEELTQYRSQTNFQLSYPVDFADVNTMRDSVLMVGVRVITLDNRGFNSTYRIDLRRLSFPELTMPGNDVVSTTTPFVFLRGSVTTGIYKLKSVRAFIEGQLVWEAPQADIAELSEYEIQTTVPFDFQGGQEYPLRIEVRDERDEMRQWELTVKGIEFKRPATVQVVAQNNIAVGTMLLGYDTNGRTIRIEQQITDAAYAWSAAGWGRGRRYIVDITRHADGRVSEMNWTFNHARNATAVTTGAARAVFTYNGDQVSKIEYGAPTAFPSQTMTNFVWEDDGTTLRSFDYNGATTIDVHYEDGFVPGEKIFAERWTNTLSVWNVGTVRYHTEFVPVLNPLWIEGMPPFWCPGTLQREMTDMFWQKYIYTKDVPGPRSIELDENPNTYFPDFTYTNDENGQLQTFVRPIDRNNRWTYHFEY